MHARTGTLQVSPERIDDAVGQLEADQLPRFREQRGYKGFTVLADRESGKLIGVSFWDRAADLEASEQLAAEAREQAASTGQAEGEPAVGRFEVVLDDMV